MIKKKKMYITKGKYKNKFIIINNNKKLRPTKAIIKKNIFGWLENILININKINILDCYAGSGILTFEIISRFININKIILLDNNKFIITNLYKNIKLLNINKINIKIIKINCLKYLKKNNNINSKFNLIFIDPPYYKNYILPTIQLLNNNNWIDKQAIIYIEYEKKKNIIYPNNWKIYNQKITSNSIYQLFYINNN